MDTELEFDTPIDLLEGVTDEYTEDAEAGLEAPAAPAPQPAPDEGPAQSALTAYMRSLSRSRLLDAEQEQVLGAELLEAREEMADALGSVPALVL